MIIFFSTSPFQHPFLFKFVYISTTFILILTWYLKHTWLIQISLNKLPCYSTKDDIILILLLFVCPWYTSLYSARKSLEEEVFIPHLHGRLFHLRGYHRVHDWRKCINPTLFDLSISLPIWLYLFWVSICVSLLL